MRVWHVRRHSQFIFQCYMQSQAGPPTPSQKKSQHVAMSSGRPLGFYWENEDTAPALVLAFVLSKKNGVYVGKYNEEERVASFCTVNLHVAWRGVPA